MVCAFYLDSWTIHFYIEDSKKSEKLLLPTMNANSIQLRESD